MILPHQVTFPEVVDASMRRTFVSCPRKWLFNYGMHRSSTRESIHLRAGGAFAEAIEHARIAHWGEGLSPAESLDRGIRALILHYGEEDNQAEDEGSAKTLENMILALDDYFRHYGWKTDYIQPFMTGGKPAVEFSFAFPIDVLHPVTGNPLIYAGRFDMVGVYNNVLWVVDEKTAGQLGGSWMKNWPMRDQITGYAYAASQYGFTCAGAIIRGVSVQKTQIKHAEAIVYRPGWQIDRWMHQLQRDVHRMIGCWKEQFWDYNLGDACTSYGGCKYMDACLSQQPERWLEANTVERKWSPLETVDTKELSA